MQFDSSAYLPADVEFLDDEALDFFAEDFEFSDEDDADCESTEEPLTAAVPSGQVVLVPVKSEVATAESVLPASLACKINNKQTRKYQDVLKEDQIAKMRKNHKRLTLQQSKQASTGEVLSRAVCNSIHTAYPQMFMNTVNSADLSLVQSYFGAFMSGPCTFMVRQKINRQYGLPNALSAFGPQLFTHYLLGCFVSFPDMAIKMRDSRTISASGRTRIVIDVTVCGTKMFDIPEYEWAPDVERMPELYHHRSGASSPAHSSSDSGSDSSVSPEEKRAPAPETAAKTAGSRDVTAASDVSPILDITEKKKKKNKNDKSKLKLPMIMPSAANVAAAQRVPRIPQAYVAETVGQARFVPAPHALNTLGSITLFLDEHNCMQHVLIDLEEQNLASLAQASVQAEKALLK